jgi:hypothetical protein
VQGSCRRQKRELEREKLEQIAYRVERLTPSPRNPMRFHEDKSEIVAELYRLALEVRHG